MTDLLYSDANVNSRQGKNGSLRDRRRDEDASPSPASPKELFTEFRTLASGEYITTNLSRAVWETIEESASNAARQEFGELGGLQNGYEILGKSVFIDNDQRSDELNERLAMLVREAERIGRLPQDVESQLRIAISKGKPSESFIRHARRLDERGQTDIALDLIFDQIDEMLLAGQFECVNELLADIPTDKYSLELLLGILTATLPAKNRMPVRAAFFERVSRTLENRGERNEGLLVGLD